MLGFGWGDDRGGGAVGESFFRGEAYYGMLNRRYSNGFCHRGIMVLFDLK